MDKNVKDVLKAVGVGILTIITATYLTPRVAGWSPTILGFDIGPVSLAGAAVAGLTVYAGKMLVDKIEQ